MDLMDHDFFFKIVKTIFAKRRKTLLNNLRSLHLLGYSDKDVAKALKDTGIDGARRGETLTADGDRQIIKCPPFNKNALTRTCYFVRDKPPLGSGCGLRRGLKEVHAVRIIYEASRL